MAKMTVSFKQIDGHTGIAPWDVVAVDPEVPVGLSIVGQAQAGKTTARGMIERTWEGFEAGPALCFSASDGFRGLSADVIRWAGIDPATEPDAGMYADSLMGYLDVHEHEELAAQLDWFYKEPLPQKELRSRAVNRVVSFTSGHPLVRPQVSAAASRHLSDIIKFPELAGLDRPPSLVVLDGRNAPECRDKFVGAGVISLGTIVLTCNEIVAARRKLDSDTPDEALMSEAAKLRQRNEEDRARPESGGKMTLPADLQPAYFVEEPAKVGDVETLYQYGRRVPLERDAGLAVATDTLTLTQEAFALDISLRGMLSVAYAVAKR